MMNVDVIKQMVEDLEVSTNEAMVIVRDNQAVLESLQKVCPHKWIETGHDSNYSYEECKYCKKEERT